jgi:DNA topoisomerase I
LTIDEAAGVAQEAGLRYVTDQRPGISRFRMRGGFAYRTASGERITDATVLARIRALAIPPAWTDVWIAPISNAHLQATGRDQRGRKQYRYHEKWRAARDLVKFGRMAAFARALPALRARVDEDLGQPGLPRTKVLATVVRLLELTRMRVGNEAYARANGSYGLTTLQNKHAKVAGSVVAFSFRGKSGKDHLIDIRDRQLARIVSRCQELPGHELFEYIDEDGALQSVDSADVNAYLREIAGADFTAKDFRTWSGTVIAANVLAAEEVQTSQTAQLRSIRHAYEVVASELGNTVAVTRKFYVHPLVIEAFVDGRLSQVVPVHLDGLREDECLVLGLLEESASANAAAA